jgi:hypothetical protein
MSVNGGPNIIENGLVFSVDAADKTSYSGTGTAWNDLVGSNNGVLTNGPTFSTDGKGSIVFDGTNDYVSTSLSSTSNAPYTINIVFKIQTFTSTDMRLLGAISGSSDQLTVGWDTNTFKLWLDNTWNNTSFVSSTNTTYFLSLVHQGTDNTVYVNGIYNSIITNKTSYFNNLGFGNTFILSYGTFFSGNIYLTQLYNRALSGQEIFQNYNNTKSRFGL